MKYSFIASRIVCVCCFLILSFEASARGKKVDYKRKTVLITDSKGAVHTGFIADHKGEKVVVCLEKVFGVNSKITDLDGNDIAYSQLLIPVCELKRGILFIQIQEPAENISAFEIETDVSTQLKTGSKVSIRGAANLKRRIVGGKGTVGGITDSKIRIKSRMVSDLTGAPVISKDSGKVVGVAFFRKNGKRHQLKYAVRIENIAKFQTVSKKEVENEGKRCLVMRKAVRKYAGAFSEIEELIRKNGLSEQKKSFKNIDAKTAKKLVEKIKILSNKLDDAEKGLSKIIRKLKKNPEMKVPAIKELFRQNCLRGEEIIEKKFNIEEKKLEKILKKLNKREFSGLGSKL